MGDSPEYLKSRLIALWSARPPATNIIKSRFEHILKSFHVRNEINNYNVEIHQNKAAVIAALIMIAPKFQSLVHLKENTLIGSEPVYMMRIWLSVWNVCAPAKKIAISRVVNIM